MRTLKNLAAIAITIAFLVVLPAIANATTLHPESDDERVPDGGTTAMLLGSALAGVGVMRRYLKN